MYKVVSIQPRESEEQRQISVTITKFSICDYV